jgi:hypothetical protein
MSNWTGSDAVQAVQFKVSDFGFEVQDSSNFKFPSRPRVH